MLDTHRHRLLKVSKSGSSPPKTYTTRVSVHFLHVTVYFMTSYKVSLVMKCHAHPDELESAKIGFLTIENLYNAGFSPFSSRYRVFHDEFVLIFTEWSHFSKTTPDLEDF